MPAKLAPGVSRLQRRFSGRKPRQEEGKEEEGRDVERILLATLPARLDTVEEGTQFAKKKINLRVFIKE